MLISFFQIYLLTPLNTSDNRSILKGNLNIFALVELSSRVEYALLALMELADHYEKGTAMKISEISQRHTLPERYLEQILTNLRRERIVQSQRGAKGGYVLIREPWQITVLEIITIVEGEGKLKETDSSQSLTPEQRTIYEIWQQATQATQAVLSGETLQSLCQKRDNYRQTNPMYYI